MTDAPPRLAVRALIVERGRLLLVNAYPPDAASDLWCAPGGGVERHTSLADNLCREVHEETGLRIAVGPLALVNEFHDPDTGFHEAGVTQRRFFLAEELGQVRFKPDSLARVAFASADAPHYDPLERLVR